MSFRRARRDQQQGWDALRSELMGRFDRAPSSTLIEPDIKPVFRLDEGEPYYGPTRDARERINGLLGLEPTAGQTEWEAQAADPSRLDALVEALGDPSVDVEARSAIVLLLLECADAMSTEMLARVRWHLRRDPVVQARMRYWWTHMDGCGAVMEALS